MERYKKKDMLQTVDTLLRANDAVVKSTVSNPQGASEALMQCQESAIMLGTAIETYGEEYTPLVRILEDYCENLYQMNENLSDEALRRKTAKKIQKQLTSLQNSIKYDLPEDKKEVVFLPYKASMWDSLESVWKAADADPDCNAYVIPIPYFDKNPDGSFKEEHYEGDQYPKNVPITRYDEYNLEKRHPDVIYIHNPYDECNYVTSVHPYFYSKNIRKFTDKLVYIPYFILQEIEPDDQMAIDGMKHFCFTPGTIYAHQVIVQSEKMRQIYINEYIKAAKEMGLDGEHVDRRFLEKKFLGTGSPKIDKVLNTKKEDLEVPAEWLRIIEKPDGSWKKIIFYNTSVSALLHSDEKMLRKMESVFRIFQDHKDEVALLWRPHPLIQATIESMRPRLWEGYKEIRDRYVEEGWGIYDDTADMDRAVILSDAYYGDHSSVAQLFQRTEKRIRYQSADVIENGRDRVPVFGEAVVFVGSYAWVSCLVGNSIIRVDLERGKGEYKGCFPNEKPQNSLYGSGVYCGNKIFWIPCTAEKVAVLDLDTEKIEMYKIPIRDEGLLQSAKFTSGILIEDKIYAFGYTIPCVMIIDCSNMKIWITHLDIVGKSQQIYFYHAYSFINNKLFLPFRHQNRILEFDIHTNHYIIHQIEQDIAGIQGGYTAIRAYKEGFELYDWHSHKIYWQYGLGIVEREAVKELQDVQYKAYKKVLGDKNEFRFPSTLATVFIDRLDGEKMLQYSFNMTEVNSTANAFFFIEEEGERIFFQINGGECWNVINKKTMELEELSALIDANELPWEYGGILSNEETKYTMSLDVFLKRLLAEDK